GLPLITFSPDDFQATAAFNQLTLLAKFSSSVPHVNVFDVHVNTAWGLSQPATVGSLDPRHISIQLHSMDDLSIAWSRFSRTFNGQPFLLLRWSAAYKRHDSPQAALWMRLPGLPLPLHNPSFLKAIGDSLGRFLRSDDFTRKLKNPRVARLCVEMDLSAPLPPAFAVAIGELKVHQRIIYESRIPFCTRCRLQGHSDISCRNKKRKLPSVESVPSAPSGKAPSGGLLPAGTPSPGPNNFLPTMLVASSPTAHHLFVILPK
ncbi:DUF4283 domain-containing protein, partial [Cephalotus follicularis]